MTIYLPTLPSSDEIADASRQAAAAERVQPWSVEKDLYLTRLIWVLAQVHGDQLLLKGGTCLSKCDLGYHRMSEDIDFIIPGVATPDRAGNVQRLNRVPRSIREIEAIAGVQLVNFEGERYHAQSHGLWEVQYRSSLLPPTSSVVVETAIRPVLLPPRRVSLHQLLSPDLLPGYDEGFCWALDYLEVRAEKVRAAYTREEPELRDFYDLSLLARAGADMASDDFVRVLDAKLEEVGAPPLAQQPPSFGLTGTRRVAAEDGAARLAAVVRIDEPALQLDEVLEYYDHLWGKEL